jgi:hypothetical protein
MATMNQLLKEPRPPAREAWITEEEIQISRKAFKVLDTLASWRFPQAHTEKFLANLQMVKTGSVGPADAVAWAGPAPVPALAPPGGVALAIFIVVLYFVIGFSSKLMFMSLRHGGLVFIPV